jgi:hypothetical protein
MLRILTSFSPGTESASSTMDFVNNVFTLEWIGVVIVGIVINVLSAYLKGPCDWFFTRVSKWWATRSAKAKEARERRVAMLRNSKEERVMALLSTLHTRVRSVLMLLFGTLILLAALFTAQSPNKDSAVTILKIASLFPLFFGFRDWGDVIRRQSELDDARNPGKPRRKTTRAHRFQA